MRLRFAHHFVRVCNLGTIPYKQWHNITSPSPIYQRATSRRAGLTIRRIEATSTNGEVSVSRIRSSQTMRKAQRGTKLAIRK